MRSAGFPRIGLAAASGLVAVAGVTLLGFIALRPAQENATQAAQDEIDARLQAIRAEVDELGFGHPWAGVYRCSDGRGSTTFALAPRNGFASVESVCFDWGTNCGSAIERDGVVELAPRFASSDVVGVLRDTRFVPIRWATRRYLVPLERLDDFVSDVNLGAFEERPYEGSHAGRHQLALERTRQDPLVGLPELPPEHARHLLARPIDGIVLAARESPTEPHPSALYRAYEVELDRGAADGVWVGMRVALAPSGGLPHPRVVAVGEHTARANVEAQGFPGAPVAGSAWSTRERWRDANH